MTTDKPSESETPNAPTEQLPAFGTPAPVHTTDRESAAPATPIAPIAMAQPTPARRPRTGWIVAGAAAAAVLLLGGGAAVGAAAFHDGSSAPRMETGDMRDARGLGDMQDQRDGMMGGGRGSGQPDATGTQGRQSDGRQSDGRPGGGQGAQNNDCQADCTGDCEGTCTGDCLGNQTGPQDGSGNQTRPQDGSGDQTRPQDGSGNQNQGRGNN